MKLSYAKQIKAFCANLHSGPDYREILRNIGEDDFTVNNVRFISAEDIDRIQQEELRDDEYMLGCFNSDFIAGVLGIDEEVITALQKVEAFDAIGKLIISLGKLHELQAEYSATDGYGHHFNGYDGGQEEISIDGTLYYVFDNH